MAIFGRISPFLSDTRANLMSKVLVAKLKSDESPTRWLYICGPTEAATQIRMVGGSACVQTEPHPDFQAEYSHCFRFEDGIPSDVMAVAELLKEILSLTYRPPLTCGLALDWYKKPDSDTDSRQWPNSVVGELVHRGKYYKPGPKRKAARTELVQRVSQIITRHPIYRDAPIVLTVPGHDADGSSFGEGLARAVAKATSKIAIETASINGARPPSKEGASQSLKNAFKIPQALSGDVIIIDDVYRSGETMGSVALAARHAGAQRIIGLVAVRTLRN